MSNADNSLFIKKTILITIIAIYVDDIIITYNNQQEIDYAKLFLKRYFDIKYLKNYITS